MRRKIIVIAVLTVGVVGLASRGSAQNIHRDHFLTFSTPIALPNGVMLPAGRYLFRFPAGLQATGRHDLTQILSADQSTVFATLFTVPVERTASDRFEVTVTDTLGSTTPTLKAWFCDRGRTGHEFVSAPSALAR